MVYAKKEKYTPCTTCEPYLRQENSHAIATWQLVFDQVDRAGMDGTIVGIRHEPIWKVIEKFRYNTPNETDVFVKVLKIFQHITRLRAVNKGEE